VLYARYGTCDGGGVIVDPVCNNDMDYECPFLPLPGPYASAITFGRLLGQGLYFLWVDGHVGTTSDTPYEGRYNLIVSGM
jgi:prepilin-type processing-associated H-X9-DG protein